jgi:hypothetical protein
MDVFDSLKKLGNEIEDRILRMDIAAMKASVSATNVKIKWTSTKRMPADGLTKDKADAIIYLRRLLREN